MRNYYLSYDNDRCGANMVFALEERYDNFKSVFKDQFYNWMQFGPDDLHYTTLLYVRLSKKDADKIKEWINDPTANYSDSELDTLLKKIEADPTTTELFSTSPAEDWWDALRNAALKVGLDPDEVGFEDVSEDVVNKELKKIINSWFN